MNETEWDQVRELFHAVLEQPPERRGAFLDGQSQAGSAVAEEVRSLLRFADHDARFLEPPVQSDTPIVLRPADPDVLVGRRIGSYHIQRVLGVGGMGVVYEAQQEQPARSVALKVVQATPLTGSSAYRMFQREVQALARLDHPAIASIYDAGGTDDGLFYLAMELVHGTSLTQHAKDRAMSTTERLKLFGTLCRAVHYAHQRGVIHRDLKPSNILVNEGNEPKVLDFGLARLIEPGITIHTLTLDAGKIRGTLSYMSPEQATGNADRIDVRSDVYSLGVILYELIAERLPYEVQSTSIARALQTICEVQPRRGSAVFSRSCADLEPIILKALEKEPVRRYDSAGELADDIDRFLGHQPVRARGGRAMYRARKFAARHRAIVVLSGLLGLSLVALMAVGVTQAVRTAQERDAAVIAQREATEARNYAEAVAEFLIGVLEGSDTLADQQEEPTLRDVMENAAQRVEAELAHQPLVRARVQLVLGDAFSRLADYGRATALAEAALATRQSALGDAHLDVAGAMIVFSKISSQKKDHTMARRWAEKALAIRAAQLPRNDSLIAETYLDLGAADFYGGNFEAAAEHFSHALALQERLPDVAELDIAKTKSNLGNALTKVSRLEEAEALLQDALAVRREHLGDHMDTTFILDNLAHVAFARGDFAAAEEWMAEEVAMSRRLFHDNHMRLGFVLNNYGFVVRKNRGPEAALPIFQEALAVRRGGTDGPHPDVASTLVELGHTELKLQHFETAYSYYEEALDMRRRLFGDRHDSVADTLRVLGKAYLTGGDHLRAEDFLLESYDIFEANHGEELETATRTVQLLIELYEALDRQEDAAMWRSRLDRIPGTAPN